MYVQGCVECFNHSGCIVEVFLFDFQMVMVLFQCFFVELQGIVVLVVLAVEAVDKVLQLFF